MISEHGIFAVKNVFIPTNDFLDVINEFNKEFINKEFTGEPYEHYNFEWIGYERPLISEILTENGLCFSFNLAQSDEVLNKNATADDFHYERFSFTTLFALFESATDRKTGTTLTALTLFAFFESATN